MCIRDRVSSGFFNNKQVCSVVSFLFIHRTFCISLTPFVVVLDGTEIVFTRIIHTGESSKLIFMSIDFRTNGFYNGQRFFFINGDSVNAMINLGINLWSLRVVTIQQTQMSFVVKYCLSKISLRCV